MTEAAERATERDLPLARAAEIFAAKAREEAPGAATFQDFIDGMADHNVAMLESVREASPGVGDLVEELMSTTGADVDDTTATTAWHSILNHAFDLARNLLVCFSCGSADPSRTEPRFYLQHGRDCADEFHEGADQ